MPQNKRLILETGALYTLSKEPEVFTSSDQTMILRLSFPAERTIEISFSRAETFNLLRAIADVPRTMEMMKCGKNVPKKPKQKS